jgi:hypothetical protein
MRDRLAVARQSAWRQFGRRHYRLFVGFDIARALAGPVAVLVLLGAVGYGLWWMWLHLSPGRLAMWSAAAAVVLLVGYLGRELLTGAGVRRRAAGLSAWSGGSVAVLASVVLLFGASITALVR